MTEHTPGPWKYHYDADGDHVILSDSGTIIAVTGGDGYVVRPTDEANARLLSVAPEILGALNDLIHDARLIRTCRQFDGCDVCKAEAVVKKAEGIA